MQAATRRGEPIYVLFRRKLEADLCCAVPETERPPPFLNSADWVPCGRSADMDAALPSLCPKLAKQSIDLNGFYLFYAPPALDRAA